MTQIFTAPSIPTAYSAPSRVAFHAVKHVARTDGEIALTVRSSNGQTAHSAVVPLEEAEQLQEALQEALADARRRQALLRLADKHDAAADEFAKDGDGDRAARTCRTNAAACRELAYRA